jgi:hypothetical protein
LAHGTAKGSTECFSYSTTVFATVTAACDAAFFAAFSPTAWNPFGETQQPTIKPAQCPTAQYADIMSLHTADESTDR